MRHSGRMAVRPHLATVLLAVVALVLAGVVLGRATAGAGSGGGTTSPIVVTPVSGESADEPTRSAPPTGRRSKPSPVVTPTQPGSGELGGGDEPYIKVTQKPRPVDIDEPEFGSDDDSSGSDDSDDDDSSGSSDAPESSDDSDDSSSSDD